MANENTQLTVWKGVSPSRFIAGFPAVEMPAVLRAWEEHQQAAVVRLLRRGAHERLIWTRSPALEWRVVAYGENDKGQRFYRLFDDKGLGCFIPMT